MILSGSEYIKNQSNIFFIYKSVNWILSEKQKLRKEACEKYQNLFEEEKEKKSQYHRECHRNICEDEKQRILEIKKKLSNT